MRQKLKTEMRRRYKLQYWLRSERTWRTWRTFPTPEDAEEYFERKRGTVGFTTGKWRVVEVYTVTERWVVFRGDS